MDQKRIEEEKSETTSESAPSVANSSHWAAGGNNQMQTVESEVIDLKSLKERILDRNYTHIFDKAKEAAKGNSLVSFGPKLGKQCLASHYDLQSQSSHNQLKEQYQESLRR